MRTAHLSSMLVAGLLVVAGCGASEPGTGGTAGTGGTGTGGSSSGNTGGSSAAGTGGSSGAAGATGTGGAATGGRGGESGGAGANGTGGSAAVAARRAAAAEPVADRPAAWEPAAAAARAEDPAGASEPVAGAAARRRAVAEETPAEARRRRWRRPAEAARPAPAAPAAAPARLRRPRARTPRAADLTRSPSRRTPTPGSKRAPSSGRRIWAAAEKYPIFVWGEGGCSLNGLSNSAAMGEIASPRLLRHRRRHAERQRLSLDDVGPRGDGQAAARVRHLGDRREREALQRVLPEPRYDEDRRQRILVRRIDGRRHGGRFAHDDVGPQQQRLVQRESGLLQDRAHARADRPRRSERHRVRRTANGTTPASPRSAFRSCCSARTSATAAICSRPGVEISPRSIWPG